MTTVKKGWRSRWCSLQRVRSAALGVAPFLGNAAIGLVLFLFQLHAFAQRDLAVFLDIFS